jgi:hypothetical protein
MWDIVILGLSSSGGGPSCQHVDPDGDVGSGPTEIQPETLSEISLGSESGVDEKLTSEWELDVRKKAAGIWEMLSQEFAWTVSEEHGERIRAITDEMIKRQKTKGKKELLNLQSSVNYGDSKTSSRRRKGKTHLM